MAVRTGDHKSALRRCRRVADRLELPDPFDAAELLTRLGARRGRPIDLIPVDSRPNLPCGLLVSTGSTDYVLYAADTHPLHRQHILVHEFAHLLFGHAGGASTIQPLPGALLPHLSPDLVRRVLGRTCYDEPQEREAELLASLVMSRAARATPAAGRRDPATGFDLVLAELARPTEHG